MFKFNKKKLPSRHTSLGPDRAPHRSFYYAMGETEEDVAKPFVGVVSTWNEAAPCNINGKWSLLRVPFRQGCRIRRERGERERERES